MIVRLKLYFHSLLVFKKNFLNSNRGDKLSVADALGQGKGRREGNNLSEAERRGVWSETEVVQGRGPVTLHNM